MKLLHLMVVMCVLGWVAAQDPYTQGVVNGATLALAGTAVLGLGVIALKQHQNQRNRNRYRQYAPSYYEGYGYYGGYGNGYRQPQYYRRRRRSASLDLEVEREFESIMSQDKGQCGMRVVCELEARSASGDHLSQFDKLIVSLFGSNPAPVSTSALNTAHGRYGYAAYIGSKSSLSTCAELYSSCQFNSKAILKLVNTSKDARQLTEQVVIEE